MSKWKEARQAEQKAAEKQNDIPSLDELEDELNEGIDTLQQAFRDRAEKEEKRFQDVCDSAYYFVVCFSNNAQLVELRQYIGL